MSSEPSYKCVLLGDSGVGKSSLVKQYLEKTFNPAGEQPTIASSFFTCTETLGSGQKVTLKIFDTAGSERFRSLSPLYYRNSEATLVLFDVTCAESVDVAKYYIDEIRTQCGDHVQIVLVGNKIDMEDEREVSFGDSSLAEFANDNNVVYIETSAKTGQGVREAFHLAAENVYKIQTQLNKPKQQQVDVVKAVDLSQSNQGRQQQRQGGGGCC